MKQNCKHIHRDGDSCSLNNNCRYPECVKVPSAEEMLDEAQLIGGYKLAEKEVVIIMERHTRLHLEALAEEMKEAYGLHKEDEMDGNPSFVTVESESVLKILSDYLAKNNLK